MRCLVDTAADRPRPLTALGMAFGITFMSSGPGGAAGGGRVSMRDAVKLVAAEHDLANLTSIRQRGGRFMARIYVDGELRGFAVTTSLQPLQRNWPACFTKAIGVASLVRRPMW